MPVLIITSTGLRIYFGNTDAGSLFIKGISPLIQFFLLLTPYIVSWIMFLVLYMALPNTKVKFVNAGIAALFTSVFFNIFQQIYIWGQVFLNRYNVVYGSFAAVPLLLMFIQISCIIMLLGAEIAYASQNVANFDYETDTDNISPHYKHFLTLYVVRCIIKRFEHGQRPMSAEQIALENHLPIRLTMQILKDMVNAKVLIEVFADPTTGKSYQPARDINTLSIRTITSMRMHYGTENFINNLKTNNIWTYEEGFWYIGSCVALALMSEPE
jgi:membrane protein